VETALADTVAQDEVAVGILAVLEGGGERPVGDEEQISAVARDIEMGQRAQWRNEVFYEYNDGQLRLSIALAAISFAASDPPPH
jgi:hypothetical protein